MRLNARRSGKLVPGALAAAAALTALIASICVYVAASYGLGPIGALLFFVAYASVIAGVMFAWQRYASRLR